VQKPENNVSQTKILRKLAKIFFPKTLEINISKKFPFLVFSAIKFHAFRTIFKNIPVIALFIFGYMQFMTDKCKCKKKRYRRSAGP